MATLKHIVESNKTLCSIGFDDAPRPPDGSEGEGGRGGPVGLAGVVCKSTRFDGMVWGEIEADGWDAGQTICELLEGGKFLPQLHLVVLDGIAFGGFNVVDLEALAGRLKLPCVTVMRQRPHFEAIERALGELGGSEQRARRMERMRRAGPVHEGRDVYFQVCGADPTTARRALHRLTRDGHIPEPVRIAHLVAAAVADGESGRRA